MRLSGADCHLPGHALDEGHYGGRFSGAGFKGACIALVDPAETERIRAEITDKYLAKFPQYGKTFEVFFCTSEDGARFIE